MNKHNVPPWQTWFNCIGISEMTEKSYWTIFKIIKPRSTPVTCSYCALKLFQVDGGQYSSNDETYGHGLLKAMMLARTKLNCSFIGEGGRDVISDLLENLVKPRKPNERKPRHYKFVSVNFRFTCIYYFLFFGSGRTGWRIKFCFTQFQIHGLSNTWPSPV